ncbi:glycosyltransferase [Pseudomonadales bacterium]|nr:glycosyltransferase [Pseudomonadales bacterium]
MIVDQLNTSLRGGAAIAARRLHQGLMDAGETSRLWCKHARSPDELQGNIAEITFRESVSVQSIRQFAKYKIHERQLRGRSDEFEIFSMPWAKTKASHYSESPLEGDVLHLHWVNWWFDFPSFFNTIPTSLPIVWTLHDMNPITGGCHHHDGCEHFHSQCGNCPQLKYPRSNDVSRLGFEAKKRAYQGKEIHVVTPSRWLRRQVEQSDLMSDAASVRTIYNGLDTKQFAPIDRATARRELGLPLDKTVLGFGAVSLANRRKGLREFISSVSKLNNVSDVICLGFGDADASELQQQLPQFRTTGYLSNARDLALAYSASDVFVLPSFAENMPQMAVEAMACETPVAAFDVGGIPEIVIAGKTGSLAPLGNCNALAANIQAMIDDPIERLERGRAARKLIVREFDQGKQTEKYLELYHSIAPQATHSCRGRKVG